VYLAELEELNLRRMKPNQHENFLPLLLPGRKPLSLSIQVLKPSETGLFSTTVLDFLNRSNVVALYIQGYDFPRLPLEKLLMDPSVNVRILSLEALELKEMTSPMSPDQPHLVRLDCLNLMSSIFKMETLRELVNFCPIQVLKLINGAKEPEILDELATIFPMVKCMDSSAPIEEWDS
ncbi:hypothetical protein FRC11_013680, partial [Ceratobasidium sp. 423]